MLFFTIVSRGTFYAKMQKTPHYEEPFAVDVGCEREGYGWLSPLYKNTAYIVIGG